VVVLAGNMVHTVGVVVSTDMGVVHSSMVMVHITGVVGVNSGVGVYSRNSGDVEALGLEGGEVTTDDSSVLGNYNGLASDVGGLDDLLVDGLGVLDDGGGDDVTLEDGLDLLDDGLLDDLVNDGGVDDLSGDGGIDLSGGEDNVLGNGS